MMKILFSPNQIAISLLVLIIISITIFYWLDWLARKAFSKKRRSTILDMQAEIDVLKSNARVRCAFCGRFIKSTSKYCAHCGGLKHDIN